MNHRDSSSDQTFPNNTLAPPPSDVVYVQSFATPRSKPSHETWWSTSIGGCCSDMGTCLVTCACPCITAGRITEIVDEGKTSCIEGAVVYALLSMMCVHGIYTCHKRSKMRKQHKLRGNNCDDCFAHFCCLHCALCQEYRELYRLGFDPAIGWHENVERQRNAVAVFKITPPQVEEGMMR